MCHLKKKIMPFHFIIIILNYFIIIFLNFNLTNL